MSATVNPLVRRCPCPWCGVEVLAVDVDWDEAFLDVGEADSLMGEAVLLGERDEARRCFASTKRRKGEALHRVHVCALAEEAA